MVRNIPRVRFGFGQIMVHVLPILHGNIIENLNYIPLQYYKIVFYKIIIIK